MPSDEFTPVRLPLMGEGVHEATIVRWFQKEGEAVRKDESFLEVSTDKVDTEIPAPATGFLRTPCLPEGTVVNVGQILAIIGKNPETAIPEALIRELSSSSAPTDGASMVKTSSAAISAATATAERESSGGKMQPAGEDYRLPTEAGRRALTGGPALPETWAGSVRSSPLVRKIARHHGISLHQVPGSGLYGRITRKDLEQYLNFGGSRFQDARRQEERSESRASRVDSPLFGRETRTEGGVEYLEGVAVRREAMSRTRLRTAEHMIRSVRIAPHVTTTFEIDLQAVWQTRKTLGEAFYQEHGSRLTYTAFFLYFASRTLLKHPSLNATIDRKDILYRDDINIGCAVATGDGLFVPVIRKASELSLSAMALTLNELVKKAREKRLSPGDIVGGTFSLTNPGMYGSLHSQPIIHQPQSAILSVGAVTDRPVAVNNAVVIHPLCQAGLTFDHRLVDGEGGALFLRDLRDQLESCSMENLIF